MKMGPSLEQRIFDVLKASEVMLTVETISFRTHVEGNSVKSALQRLRDKRAIISVCREKVWTYCLREGAKRPDDGRGRPLPAHRRETTAA